MGKKVLFSGIQPTGELHIGNYLGAIKNWVKIQSDYDSIFCVVDLHAQTIEYDQKEMPRRVQETATVLLACGLDPERCTLFKQSYIPGHSELMWRLTTITPIGDLERMTQYKDKAQQHRDNINAGLFTYPVLMAADIMLYKAEVVPVGDDQVQHLELTREIVRRFNHRFGEVFPEPKPLLSTAPRIRGLDGKAKMSKSLNNAIGLTESPDSIRKKLASAFTDPARLRRSDPGHPEVCNIFTLHGQFSPPARCAEIAGACTAGMLGCVDCKREFADRLIAELEPIQARAAELRAKPERVQEILREGGRRCRARSERTIADVNRAMGL